MPYSPRFTAHSQFRSGCGGSHHQPAGLRTFTSVCFGRYRVTALMLRPHVHEPGHHGGCHKELLRPRLLLLRGSGVEGDCRYGQAHNCLKHQRRAAEGGLEVGSALSKVLGTRACRSFLVEGQWQLAGQGPRGPSQHPSVSSDFKISGAGVRVDSPRSVLQYRVADHRGQPVSTTQSRSGSHQGGR